MDQATPPPSTPQPTEQQPPPQQPPPPQTSPPTPSSSSLPPSSSSLPSTSSTSLPSSPNPNPNPNSKLPTPQPPQQSQPQSQQQPPQQQPSVQNAQTRPPFNRPWQQPPHFSHFSSHLSSIPPHSSSSSPSPPPPPLPPFSSSPSSSISAPPVQRGGMAIGVPAHHPSPPPPPTSFSSLNPPSFGQQFGGLGRNAVNVPDSLSSSSTSQARQPIQGIQGMGMMGSLGSSSPMRPGGVSAHHQLRPLQSSLRPQTSPSNPSPASQNFQGHGMLRVSSVGSPVSSSPNSSQSQQPHNQPWLSPGSQGKPPLPPQSLRPQMNPQSLQQRSHIPPQHHHPMSTTPQQQQTSSVQQPQPPLPSHQPQEHYGQQFPPSRAQQPLAHQQQITRGQGSGGQKPSSHVMVQSSVFQPGPPTRTVSAETGEYCNRILSKRSIQELVTQIDPSERLDPEVEDILVDIADEFVESITTFGCSLAKHRKSTTLEAKDILLHLERNWNMTLPGFSGDEIKSYKKPFASDIHKERLAAIKKSVVTAETANTRALAQAGGNAKGHLAKAPAIVIGSPNSKIREAA